MITDVFPFTFINLSIIMLIIWKRAQSLASKHSESYSTCKTEISLSASNRIYVTSRLCPHHTTLPCPEWTREDTEDSTVVATEILYIEKTSTKSVLKWNLTGTSPRQINQKLDHDSKTPRPQIWLCHLLIQWPWVSYLTSPSLFCHL